MTSLCRVLRLEGSKPTRAVKGRVTKHLDGAATVSSRHDKVQRVANRGAGPWTPQRVCAHDRAHRVETSR